jgi:hypothetical protein
MTAATINIGHHARVPAKLIAETEKPRALQILNHLLTLCNPQNPEVWIDQQWLGNKLGIHRDTVGRWIRHLEQIGRLVFLGFRNDGRRKRYLIKLPNEEVPIENKRTTKPLNITSDNFVGRSQVKRSDDTRRFCRNINRIEKTNNKEQTVVDLCKREFSPNEKIAIKQKLKAVGLHKNSIEKLVTKFSLEKINDQIIHLKTLIDAGDNIKKPAAWLIAAVENNYDIINVVEKNSTNENHQGELSRQAAILAQTARNELLEGNHRKAQQTASKSLEITPNTVAGEILKEATMALERIEKIEIIQRQASLEDKQKIQREAEEEKSKELRRWFKSEAEMRLSKFFKGAVEALVNQRLIEAE